MVKMMAAIRRRAGMTQQEFFRYIREIHGGMTRSNPLTIRRYIQNHVFDGAFGAEKDTTYEIVFHRDSVTELWFDSFDSMKETFMNPFVRDKVGPDGVNFNDLPTALAIVTREVEGGVPDSATDAPIKVMYWLRKAADISLEEFFRRWASTHEAVLHEQAQVAAAIRRCVRSLQMPEGNPMLGYFGGKDIPIYEGVTNLWYQEAGALDSFRAYQSAVEAHNLKNPFFVPSGSFFLMAREVLIVGPS